MEGIVDAVTRWIEAGGLELGLLGRLSLAAVLGGLIGWEREVNGKPAGLRTNLLICVGAALVADISLRFAALTPTDQVRADPGRIAAQIVSGVGFLGAGTILQSRGSVAGLTTAATLWVVAAIGMAAGSGSWIPAVGTTALVLVALVPLGWLEDRVEAARTSRLLHVELRAADRGEAVDRVRGRMEELGAKARLQGVSQDGERVELVFEVRAGKGTFEEIRDMLLEDGRVRALRYDR